MMKKSITFLFFLVSFSIFSQEYSFIPEGFQFLKVQELSKLNRKFKVISTLNSNGDKLTAEEVDLANKSFDYEQQLFTNDESMIIVYKKLSKEEKKAREKKSDDYLKNAKKALDSLNGSVAPDFDVTDIHGNKFKLSDLKGKVVVINFWFLKCAPCIQEIPELNKVALEFKDKDVVFVSFSFDDKKLIEKFLETKKMEYNPVANSLSVSKSYNITSYPTNIVIDQNGIVSFIKIGYTASVPKKIKSQINKLLKS